MKKFIFLSLIASIMMAACTKAEYQPSDYPYNAEYENFTAKYTPTETFDKVAILPVAPDLNPDEMTGTVTKLVITSGNWVAASTKDNITVSVLLNNYVDGALMKSVNVTKQAKWNVPTGCVSAEPVGYYTSIKGNNTFSVSYASGYKCTPRIRFAIGCSYTDENGTVYTASANIYFEETHFVFMYIATNTWQGSQWTTAYPVSSETLPCELCVLASNNQADEYQKQTNWNWLMGKNNRTIDHSDMPVFKFKETATNTKINFISINKTNGGQSYYDNEKEISYFFVIDNDLNYINYKHQTEH